MDRNDAAADHDDALLAFVHLALQGERQIDRAGNVTFLVEVRVAAGADPAVHRAFHQDVALPFLVVFHVQRARVGEHGDEVEVLRDRMRRVAGAQRPVGRARSSLARRGR